MTTPTVPIRVLLADDETMIRAAVRMILSHADGIEVVGEAADGRQAVTEAASHRPDVVLLDIYMPVHGGLAAVAPLLALDPAPRVLMLTTFGTDDNVLTALRDGAAGFLLKDEGPEELIRAVRAAAAGDSVLSPQVTGAVVARMLSGVHQEAAPGLTDERIARLTGREREVLKLIGEGLSNQEIAGRLRITVGTVKTHVVAVFAKTDTTSRVQAAVLAHRTGLVH
ncbi:response regulator transcription factor [Streptomyces sp. CLV115]|uniref:response regulator transcription factor n=1 Tax=Streptomyces sp. CLV115 TaxID=3138502 RepID=UPI00313E86B7